MTVTCPRAMVDLLSGESQTLNPLFQALSDLQSACQASNSHVHRQCHPVPIFVSTSCFNIALTLFEEY